ncbi:MAG: hypothetical protein ACHQNT_07210 [Bacteroidia bacterium]
MTVCNIPYRLDLAGSWHDQPFVSKHADGGVITLSILPTHEFDDRSGLASSTRKSAIELWKTSIPDGDMEQLGKILFCYDNPPGTKDISGAQDALGIVLPGLNYLYFKDGNYWPVEIKSIHDESILSWLEQHICMVSLGPRVAGCDVLSASNINPRTAKTFADATLHCWNSILAKDVAAFGKAMTAAFEAQVVMLPNCINDEIRNIVKPFHNRTYGWKLAGAGGGGYLVLVTDKEIEESVKIKIRRKK